MPQAENPAAGSNPAVESGAAGSDAVGRKATPINGPFVPMLEGAFDMATVERSGQHYGYMSNEGPVKVRRAPVARWPALSPGYVQQRAAGNLQRGAGGSPGKVTATIGAHGTHGSGDIPGSYQFPVTKQGPLGIMCGGSSSASTQCLGSACLPSLLPTGTRT